jgi:cardiolipin synthase
VEDAVAYGARATALVASIQAATRAPLVAGNQARLLVDGPPTYRAVRDAVEQARHSIHVEAYIFDDDELGTRFADLLAGRARSGVRVRVIYDAFGSRASDDRFFAALEAQGVEVEAFDALALGDLTEVDTRDHRKLVIVDGWIGFTGGINISSTYASGSSPAPGPERGVREGWRDTQIEIRGPAVRSLQAFFLDTWARLGRTVDPNEPGLFPPPEPRGPDLVQVVASEGGDDHEFRIYHAYLAAIRGASSRVWITQAYFAPNRELRDALVAAAGRGVDVRVILPGFTDSRLIWFASRSTYAGLLEGGVALYEFDGALLHAKTALVDGVWSTVGSFNLDARSLAHNNELNVALASRAFGREMEALFHRDLSRAQRIDAAAWRERPVVQRGLEWASSWLLRWL